MKRVAKPVKVSGTAVSQEDQGKSQGQRSVRRTRESLRDSGQSGGPVKVSGTAVSQEDQ